jgi:glycosyltransferase involved in cell wall biosynthesis
MNVLSGPIREREDALWAAGPLVSIITPSFNQGRYLLETLQSVAEQDYPNIEHIVMDGGSTDDSVEILRAWADSHPVQWQSGPDDGQAAAIQHGVEKATGELVAWLNSDDTYLDPFVVSAAVAEYRKGATVVTGGGWYLTEEGSRLIPIPVYASRLSHEVLRCVDWVLQPATFIQRDLLLKCPLDVTLHYAFDWDLFIRLSERATFAPVEAEWAGYRLHDSGKTISGGSRRRRELLKVARRYHGRSVRYAMMKVFDLGFRTAESLPAKPRRAAVRLLDSIARLSHNVTGGRGIQT